MFFFKLLCAVICPPSVLFFLSSETKEKTNAVLVIILGTLSGGFPGVIAAVLYLLMDTFPNDDENSEAESTEAESTDAQVPQQQSTDVVQDSQDSIEARLSKLNKLLENGTITEDEYSKKRNKIIDDI